MSDRTCLYPGSFDPVTLGHMDLIQRASVLFDKVYVGILHNPDKQGFFAPEQRKRMLEEACQELSNVEIVISDGLTVNLMRDLNTRVLLRGVRSYMDFESEVNLSRINQLLYPGIETLFLAASPDRQDISSSAVRQILSFGGDASAFVPASVIKAINNDTK